MKAGLVEISWTLPFQILNTLILFWALKRLLFKPVTEFMEKRQSSIAAAIKDAEHKNTQAEELKAQYASKINEVQNEAREIIKEATKRAEDRSNEIIKEAQTEAVKIKERAEADSLREQKKAINVLKDELATLAVMAAGKIVNKNLDQEGHTQLIQEFINEVGDEKWKN